MSSIQSGAPAWLLASNAAWRRPTRPLSKPLVPLGLQLIKIAPEIQKKVLSVSPPQEQQSGNSFHVLEVMQLGGVGWGGCLHIAASSSSSCSAISRSPLQERSALWPPAAWLWAWRPGLQRACLRAGCMWPVREGVAAGAPS